MEQSSLSENLAAATWSQFSFRGLHPRFFGLLAINLPPFSNFSKKVSSASAAPPTRSIPAWLVPEKLHQVQPPQSIPYIQENCFDILVHDRIPKKISTLSKWQVMKIHFICKSYNILNTNARVLSKQYDF